MVTRANISKNINSFDALKEQAFERLKDSLIKFAGLHKDATVKDLDIFFIVEGIDEKKPKRIENSSELNKLLTTKQP